MKSIIIVSLCVCVLLSCQDKPSSLISVLEDHVFPDEPSRSFAVDSAIDSEAAKLLFAYEIEKRKKQYIEDMKGKYTIDSLQYFQYVSQGGGNADNIRSKRLQSRFENSKKTFSDATNGIYGETLVGKLMKVYEHAPSYYSFRLSVTTESNAKPKEFMLIVRVGGVPYLGQGEFVELEPDTHIFLKEKKYYNGFTNEILYTIR